MSLGDVVGDGGGEGVGRRGCKRRSSFRDVEEKLRRQVGVLKIDVSQEMNEDMKTVSHRQKSQLSPSETHTFRRRSAFFASIASLSACFLSSSSFAFWAFSASNFFGRYRPRTSIRTVVDFSQ